MSTAAVEHGAQAGELAAFAEMVFAYIDELSAASVAGHADELETTGRLQARRRDQLRAGAGEGRKCGPAAPARRGRRLEAPRTLTAVVLPQSHVRRVLAAGRRPEPPPGRGARLPQGLAVLLVASAAGSHRGRLVRALEDGDAVLGPARPWEEVRSSYTRALRGVALGEDGVVDTEDRLADLVLRADAEALADLRERALAPLADLKPAARTKLEETLRAWLLHLGRREDVAAALFVHPQTVRYRMGQLRDLYGDRLDDPEMVRALVLALS